MQKLKIISLIVMLGCLFQAGAYPLDQEDEKFYIATKAYDDNFYDASMSLFKRFTDDFPRSKKIAEANLYIAKCYYFKEEYPKALAVLEGLVTKKDAASIHDEVFYWLAEAHTRGRNFKNVLFYTQKITNGFKDSKFYWWAYDLMAKSYLELDNEKEAQAILEKIINECKERELVEGSYLGLLTLFYQHKEKSEIVEWAERYIKQYPRGNFLAKVYFYLADSYMTQKEHEKAIIYFNKALDLGGEPALVDTINQGLAFAYLAKDNRETAKNILDKIQSEEMRSYSWGMYYFTTKEFTKALEAFDSFLAAFSQSKFIANIYLNRADTLYEMGRINDSLAAYRGILETYKSQKDFEIADKAHYGLAWCYLRSGSFKKAIDEFKNTLKFTDNPIVKISSQIQIADVYQESENYSQALEIYNEMLKSNPNTIYADYIQFQIGMIFLKTKKVEESFLAFRNLAKNFPSSKLVPQAQYYLAVGYFSTESYAQAKKVLEDFVRDYPQHDLLAKAQYLYGKCFFNEKDYAKAAEIFRSLIDKTKDKDIEALVYIDLGNAYLNASAFDKAKNIWEDFLSKYPQSQFGGSVALYLGGLYEKEDNTNEAQRYYSKVINEYSKSMWADEALLSLGDLSWRKGDIVKAEECFNKLIQADTLISLKAKLYLAQLYVQKNEQEKAFKLFNELTETSSSISKLALLEKAFLLKESKQYSQAIVMFKKSIEAGLDSARLRFDLAFSYEKLEKIKDAIDEYYRVVYTFGDNEYKTKAYFHIAKLYELTGRIEAAREIYKKIIAFNNDDSKVAQEKLKTLEMRFEGH